MISEIRSVHRSTAGPETRVLSRAFFSAAITEPAVVYMSKIISRPIADDMLDFATLCRSCLWRWRVRHRELQTSPHFCTTGIDHDDRFRNSSYEIAKKVVWL
jgi:hypothetical protein